MMHAAETAVLPDAFRARLRELFAAGDLELPMLPTVAREVLALCQSEQVNAQKLSSVLHRDPSLASHVLRIANSPLYQANVPIVSLQQAISRLGLRTLSEVAIAVAVEGKLFQRGDAQEVLSDLWRHAVAAGLLAKEIARTRRRNVESAFLCGLLHDVGKPVVLGVLLDRRAEFGVDLTLPTIHAAMDELHAEVGSRLALAWQMPQAVEESIRFHHGHWSDAPTSAEAAMMTCLADWLAYVALPSPRRPVTADEVRSLAVLEALNLYPDELEALLAFCPTIPGKVQVIG